MVVCKSKTKSSEIIFYIVIKIILRNTFKLQALGIVDK